MVQAVGHYRFFKVPDFYKIQDYLTERQEFFSLVIYFVLKLDAVVSW